MVSLPVKDVGISPLYRPSGQSGGVTLYRKSQQNRLTNNTLMTYLWTLDIHDLDLLLCAGYQVV